MQKLFNKKPLFYFSGLVLSTIGLMVLAQKDTVPSADTEMKCNMFSLECAAKKQNCCGQWDPKSDLCIRGEKKGGMCKEKRWLSVGISLLFLLWLVLLVLFIGSLFSCYGGGKKRGRRSKRSRR